MGISQKKGKTIMILSLYSPNMARYCVFILSSSMASQLHADGKVGREADSSCKAWSHGHHTHIHTQTTILS